MIEFPQMDSGLVVPVFTQGDDLIAYINKAMAFLSAVAASRFPSINLEPPLIRETRPLFKMARLLCNKFKGGKDKVMLVLAIRVMLLVPREIMQEGRQGLLNVINGKVNDIWLGNALSLRGQGTLHGLRKRQCWLKHGNLTGDLDAYDSDYDDVSNAKAVLIANLSNYGLDVISEVPNSKFYHNDLGNQSVHALQDFEQTIVVDLIDNEITSDNNIISYSQYLQETQQAAV
ncbi:hypothetical protein Tco_0247240 [Tanacetum coccineum]